MKQISVLHFGAGNIGRGLIANIYKQNDVKIYFIDTNKEVVDKLNQLKKYQIINVETNEKIEINDFKAIWSNEEKKIVDLINEVNIVSTSIQSNNLVYIQKYFQKADKSKKKDIYCFENGNKISEQFKKSLNLNSNWNFINVSIDCIIPQVINDEKMTVYVENYFEIIAQNNCYYKLKLIKYVDQIDPYIIRKLVLINGLHSAIGYLGHFLNYQYTNQSFNDENIKKQIQNLANDLILALNWKYNQFNKEDLIVYWNKITKRFCSKYINDLNVRVARNPLQKISINERFFVIYRLLNEANIDKINLIKIINYLLKFDYKNDLQSLKMQKELNNNLQLFLNNYFSYWNKKDLKTLKELYKGERC
ncbi:mannitol-1-phosphate 5-dehydrogenase [Mesomycoplasma lagogenitalium]|uniref:Mannitol-1-phosphate 5-dehydrogenase n=1 Tax=Mesomycoplasma lagogenitalium TaxID=171286 RepID=A0ABY8LVR7_9BACT|nr:mannitol-1-phosphate 5-dehydrogenase [Mesomycoplasma lagogenitalium]WGI36628.1 mannitol-1-phosphate 5-dehydrogenase [Mesomycoplasma lagogenitalium]